MMGGDFDEMTENLWDVILTKRPNDRNDRNDRNDLNDENHVTSGIFERNFWGRS